METLASRVERIGALPAADAVVFFEAYPHTTLVGAEEFGYPDARPRYKRLDPGLPAAERRRRRAEVCDDLVSRLQALTSATPPLDLDTHPVTALLAAEPSPLKESAHKHREDLIDAAICAWTASAWSRWGLERFQVLGASDVPDDRGRVPTLLAMARPEQRSKQNMPISAYMKSAPTLASAPPSEPIARQATAVHDLDEGHMKKKAYAQDDTPAESNTIEFVPGGAANADVSPAASTRAPSPAPTTVELLRSATWHLEHARVVGHPDDVEFEAARSALAEAVFDLEHVQYGETTRG